MAKWGPVDDYELYLRTFSSLLNSIIKAGLIIEECQESKAPDEPAKEYPDKYSSIVIHPNFLLFLMRSLNLMI